MISMKCNIVALLVVAACHAGTITTLNNTGRGLPVESTDPNWTVNGAPAYVTNDAGFPFGSPFWPANTAQSSWISPQPDYTQGQTDAPVEYIYSTQFDLTGFDPSTAFVVVHAQVDNVLTFLLLNGLPVFSFPPAPDFGLEPPAIITSGFVDGVNQFDFLTFNTTPPDTLNPNGLRINFESNATVKSIGSRPPDVPEPGAGLLVGGGAFLLLVAKMWRR